MQQNNTNKFNTDGYQVARGIIDPMTVDQVRQVLEEVLETTVDEMNALGIRVGTKNMVADIARLLNGPNASNIDKDIRKIMTGQYPLKIRMDTRLLEVLKSYKLQCLLSSALCSANLRMRMPPMARFVYPGNFSAGVPTTPGCGL